ncbi:protein FAM212A [Platysternon megacephalum]|uniref:Protein FAM212A n=1 Tax=Platysternon megacephalum TaxID=55544 RepID=A0A4D9DQK9_9SAUR|nr:protein FAM212A [Platysternon megacephalum]
MLQKKKMQLTDPGSCHTCKHHFSWLPGFFPKSHGASEDQPCVSFWPPCSSSVRNFKEPSSSNKGYGHHISEKTGREREPAALVLLKNIQTVRKVSSCTVSEDESIQR